MAANSQFAVGLHTMAVLAYLGDRFVKSDEIARSVNTNPVVIRRILQRLGRAKLVEGAPGKTGGTRLVRPPARITLLDSYLSRKWSRRPTQEGSPRGIRHEQRDRQGDNKASECLSHSSYSMRHAAANE